jgi:hypothetical protein
MTTGLEPAPATLTGWSTNQLCYVTMIEQLSRLGSNQRRRINSPLFCH